MIGSILYGLRWAIEHPVQSIVFLAPVAATPWGKKLSFAFARTAVFQLGRMLLDSGEIGKIFLEELKRPIGAPRPPLYRGTELQKAVRLGKAATTRSVATRIAPVARFLLGSPFRFYTTAAAVTIGAGYAVGRTDVVRTAPPTNTQYVLGGPL
jgi:hypothetical protein